MDNKQNIVCPHCTNSDQTMIDIVIKIKETVYYICNVCSKQFKVIQ